MSATDATALAKDQAERFRDATSKVRERSDASAKAIGALGTAGLTAVGVAEFSDIFPYPDGEWLAVAAVAIGFLVLVGTLAVVTVRAWSASRPIIVRSDLDRMMESGQTTLGIRRGPLDEYRISPAERNAVSEIYDETALLNGAPSLRAYEARAHRWDRLAERGAAEDKKLADRALRIYSEVAATQARAALILARHRAGKAVKGKAALATYLAFVLGLLLFGVGSDRLESERVDRIALAKSCADAVATGPTADLPAVCKAGVNAPGTSSASKRANSLVKFVQAWASCQVARAKADPPAPRACDSVKMQVEAAARGL